METCWTGLQEAREVHPLKQPMLMKDELGAATTEYEEVEGFQATVATNATPSEVLPMCQLCVANTELSAQNLHSRVTKSKMWLF